MTIRHLAGCATVAVGLLAAAGTRSTLAQQSGQQAQAPMFRSSTTIIEVDVVVQDKRGVFVYGLDQDDLQVYEDGKRQAIQQFYLVSHDPKAGAMPESGIAPQDSQRGRRVFVLFFDEGSL